MLLSWTHLCKELMELMKVSPIWETPTPFPTLKELTYNTSESTCLASGLVMKPQNLVTFALILASYNPLMISLLASTAQGVLVNQLSIKRSSPAMSWRAPKEQDQTTPASPYSQQQSSCVRRCIFSQFNKESIFIYLHTVKQWRFWLIS